MFTTVVLAFCGVRFFPFGVWTLVAPASLAGRLHFTLDTLGAHTANRAFAGELEIGLAAMWLAGSFHKPLAGPALVALTVGDDDVGIGRVVGLLLDGSGSPFMYAALRREAAGAAVGAIAYTRNGRSSRAGSGLRYGQLTYILVGMI